MHSFNDYKQSFMEWSPRVAERWWAMINVSLAFLPLIGGIIAYAIWARSVQPPLPIWNILLLIGGTLLFLILSFLAFHRVRMERDNLEKQLSETTVVKSDLSIGVKVKNIQTAGYYDKAEGGQAEGDKQVTIDVRLSPAKPMTLDIVALDLWGERFEAKIQRDIAPFDLAKLTPLTLTDAHTYTLVFDISKEVAIDTKEARIYALAGNLTEWFSDPFRINFEVSK